ncbi:MAG: hypothetical protein AAGI01_08395 [Myxococcota bacterium]
MRDATDSSLKDIARLSHPDYDFIRPRAVRAPDGIVHIVLEAVGRGLLGVHDGAQDNPLFYAAVALDQEKVLRLEPIAQAGPWAFHPSLAIADRSLHLAFTSEVQGTRRAFYMQGLLPPARQRPNTGESETSPFTRSVAKALEKYSMNTPSAYSNQWDLQLAASGAALLTVWLDQRDGAWALLASFSSDSGLSWSTPERVDSGASSSGAAAPVLARLGTDTFVLAWEDTSLRRTSARVVARTLVIKGPGGLTMTPIEELSEEQDWRAWSGSPNISFDKLGRAVITYMQHDQDTTTLHSAQWDTSREHFVREPILLAPEQSAHGKFFPLLLATAQDNAVQHIVLYENVGPRTSGSSITRLVTP